MDSRDVSTDSQKALLNGVWSTGAPSDVPHVRASDKERHGRHWSGISLDVMFFRLASRGVVIGVALLALAPAKQSVEQVSVDGA